ncbi:AAA family ATPase [Aliarcobacter skirrowii]|uniref:AAA family ATPase n=1 Tax=Aliarcobacter skirrowii TaxID=28200 RepID=UPI00320938ED
MNNSNIFIDTGNVIKYKDRYISRTQENIIRDIFLNKNFVGSIGISGLHKIGKTTLIEQLLNQKEDDLLKNNIIYIYIYMANYNNVDDFFNDILIKIFEILEDNELELHPLISKKLNRYYNDRNKENRESVFRIIAKKLPYKILICIDEFDKAIILFKYNSIYFQILRNFPSEYDISIIYLSRRDIHYIEERSPNNSTFANSFEGHYFLGMYDLQEQKEYFDKLSKYFIINEEIKIEYERITGYYPYLMDILSKELIKNHKDKLLTKKMIETIFKQNIDVFEYQYKEIKQILIEEDIYNELLSIILNNSINDSNKKLLLLKYGILKNINNQLIIFSESFLEYILKDIKDQNLNVHDLEQLTLYQLVETIDNLILTINDTSKNINNDVIFILTHSESEYRKKFSTVCVNKVLFSTFSSALYLTVFERTAKSFDGKSRTLFRLPKEFKREHSFVNLIDSVRHNFGGHDTRSENWSKTNRQLTRSEILIELKGNSKELLDEDDDYKKMQIKLLKLFKNYLQELYSSIGE